MYAIRGAEVVLLERRKQPNLGLWSPPGGKIEPGESPLDGALRELTEETGLVGHHPRLAAVVTELDPVRDEAWLMFCFRVDPAGELLTEHREGRAAWVPLARVPELQTPPADRHIVKAVLDDAPGVAFLTVRFDDGRLVSVDVRREG